MLDLASSYWYVTFTCRTILDSPYFEIVYFLTEADMSPIQLVEYKRHNKHTGHNNNMSNNTWLMRNIRMWYVPWRDECVVCSLEG